MCPYFPQASDENVQGSVLTKPKKFEKSGFICTVGLLYTNTDVTKTKLSKMLFKPVEFENAAFRFRVGGTRNTELFENDSVILIMVFSWLIEH